MMPQPINLLPRDGVVHYHGQLMDQATADRYLTDLLNYVAWQNDEVMLFGKHIVTKRKVALYGDKPFRYTYAKIDRHARPWTAPLLDLKQVVEHASNETYNACLLNLYHTGQESMGWHSDDERDLVQHGAIASLSFGAERHFAFKHKKTKSTITLILEHGSLLIMKGETQSHWLHQLPPTKKAKTARVNLTFRNMVKGQKLETW